MSRIGKKPVKIPSGVKVELAGNIIKVAGCKSTLTLDINSEVTVTVQDDQVMVERKGDDRFQRAMHGTTRSLIANMIEGVTKGYAKTLQIFGTGYGVKQEGTKLSLTVGMAKPALVNIPNGIEVDITTPNTRGNDVPAVFTVKGPDKKTVGQFAADIRRVRPPEPYKGKGIRFADEVVKRKMGKAFASGG